MADVYDIQTGKRKPRPPIGSEPNEALVKFLEEKLAEAKSGKLQAIGGVFEMVDDVEWRICGKIIDGWALIAGMELLKLCVSHDLLRPTPVSPQSG